MDKCTIEVDFGRQAFRVLRKPPIVPGKEQNAVTGHPFLSRLQRRYSDSSLTIYNSNRRARDSSPSMDGFRPVQHIDERQSHPYYGSSRGTSIAAGGILSSVHVPGRVDNNFDIVYGDLVGDESPLPKDLMIVRNRRHTQEMDMAKTIVHMRMNHAVAKSRNKTINSVFKNNKFNQGDIVSSRTTPTSLECNLNTTPSCMVGIEYRYRLCSDNLLLKATFIGQLPSHVAALRCSRQLFVEITVIGRTKFKPTRIAIGSRVDGTGYEIMIPMVSFVRTLEAEVHITLKTTARGFLRRSRYIDQWRFPLSDCHYMYQRSFWGNIKQ